MLLRQNRESSSDETDTLVDCRATATINLGPCGSIVEAGGRKVLRILAQLRVRRARGRGLQVAEMAK